METDASLTTSSSSAPSPGSPSPPSPVPQPGAVSVVGGLVATSAILALGTSAVLATLAALRGVPDAWKLALGMAGGVVLIAAPTSARDILEMARRFLPRGDR